MGLPAVWHILQPFLKARALGMSKFNYNSYGRDFREYEEFKVRINGLVAKAQKVAEEGWVMQDGTPCPGNNTRDHPEMIQVG
ncbi:unnamed protein product [Sphenostylis stenocarpa]|uniref:Uncharacterized protein n=1 Tax=Sphenostylis stenocarpa TaxID=92480 RepID=A0AA86RWH9_9FABA|nr:unnamed protein product [Sphenostylis stenocarpa]